MANNARIVLLFAAIIMVFLSMEIKAGKVHSPSPIPQPVVAPAPASLPLYGTTEGSLQPQECGGKCSTRCSGTQYKKPCLFFCNKCCATCLCVPPGTYGNKQFCPCYNNWKTKRGGPKCP